MRRVLARVLRCVAWRLDPRGDVKVAQARYRDAIARYARAERDLLDTVHKRSTVR
jgi:hypothetical protein